MAGTLPPAFLPPAARAHQHESERFVWYLGKVHDIVGAATADTDCGTSILAAVAGVQHYGSCWCARLVGPGLSLVGCHNLQHMSSAASRMRTRGVRGLTAHANAATTTAAGRRRVRTTATR